MAKQNQKPKKQKKQETKKTKQQKQQQKNDKTQLCHYSPPWGVQSCFFGGVLGFLVSYFLVRCWFFLQWLTKPKTKKNKKPEQHETKKNKKQNDKTQLSATTPALGVCNLGFFCFLFFVFFCFWVFLFLVFWSMLVLF